MSDKSHYSYVSNKPGNISAMTDASTKSKDNQLQLIMEESNDRPSTNPVEKGSLNTATAEELLRDKDSVRSEEEKDMTLVARRSETNKIKERIFELEHNLNTMRLEKEKVQKKNSELQFEVKMLKVDLAELKKQNEMQLSSNSAYYKEKISKLEQELAQYKRTANAEAESITKNYDALNRKYQELEKKQLATEEEMLKYKEKSEMLEHEQSKKTVDRVSYDQFKKLTKEVTELKEERQGLMSKNDELEHSVSELKIQLLDKQNQIDSLEARMGLKEQELDKVRLSYTNKSEMFAESSVQASEYMVKVSELEKKIFLMEESHNLKIANLEFVNKSLKEQLEQHNEAASQTNKQLEEEVLKLDAENEDLRRQLQEAKAKLANFKYDNKQVEEIQNQVQTLEVTLKECEEDLAKAKLNWANAEDKAEKQAKELSALEDENRLLKLDVNKLGEDVLKAKTNLGQVMNAIFEFGGSELFDKIEERTPFNEQ